MKHKFKTLLSMVLVIIFGTYIGTIYANNSDKSEFDNPDKTKLKVIIISKEDMEMKVYDSDGYVTMQFPIACGANYGNKTQKGDMKTPEGAFKITEISNASTWSHDFRDGKGVIPNAYGAHFVRLAVPGYRSIGIHGTHDPESIGTRASEGCIRLNNIHLDSLVAMLDKTETVVILPALRDILLDQEVELNAYISRTMKANRRLIQPIISQPEPYIMLPRRETHSEVRY